MVKLEHDSLLIIKGIIEIQPAISVENSNTALTQINFSFPRWEFELAEFYWIFEHTHANMDSISKLAWIHWLFYHRSKNLIGYATRYPLGDR